MDEIDYSAVFDVELGENEAAEPAQAEELTSAKEPEAAAPAAETDAKEPAVVERGVDTDAERNDPAAPDAETGDGKTDLNARFAAMRRRYERERDEAVTAARQQAQREMEETIAGFGVKNPYTGQPITTKAEFDEYQVQFAQEKRENILQSTGMSEEELDSYIHDLPEVKQAREAAQQAQQEMERARQEKAQAMVVKQVRQIAELDPAIQSLEDLTKMPDYDAFYEKVRRGMTLLEAFQLTRYDQIQERAAAAARQTAINAAGKGHMAATKTRGAGAVMVPQDVKQMYRAFNPEATDAEIQAHYNRSLQR